MVYYILPVGRQLWRTDIPRREPSVFPEVGSPVSGVKCSPGDVRFMVFYIYGTIEAWFTECPVSGVIYSVEEVRLMAYYIAKEGPGLLSTLSHEKSGLLRSIFPRKSPVCGIQYYIVKKDVVWHSTSITFFKKRPVYGVHILLRGARVWAYKCETCLVQNN